LFIQHIVLYNDINQLLSFRSSTSKLSQAGNFSDIVLSMGSAWIDLCTWPNYLLILLWPFLAKYVWTEYTLSQVVKMYSDRYSTYTQMIEVYSDMYSTLASQA